MGNIRRFIRIIRIDFGQKQQSDEWLGFFILGVKRDNGQIIIANRQFHIPSILHYQ
jgi:hypothetical protein